MEWIEEMKQEWQHDVAVLKARVANAEKMTLEPDWGARILRQHRGNCMRRAYYDDVKGAVLFSGRTQLR